MTSIEIFREDDFIAVFRTFKVMLDENKVAKVNIGKTIEIPVEPGTHELYVKIDWERSKKIMITVVEGKKQHFRCRYRGNWFNLPQMWYYAIFKFNDSLLLEKVDELQAENTL